MARRKLRAVCGVRAHIEFAPRAVTPARGRPRWGRPGPRRAPLRAALGSGPGACARPSVGGGPSPRLVAACGPLGSARALTDAPAPPPRGAGAWAWALLPSGFRPPPAPPAPLRACPPRRVPPPPLAPAGARLRPPSSRPGGLARLGGALPRLFRLRRRRAPGAFFGLRPGVGRVTMEQGFEKTRKPLRRNGFRKSGGSDVP